MIPCEHLPETPLGVRSTRYLFQAPFAKSLLRCGLDHEGAMTILTEAGGKS